MKTKSYAIHTTHGGKLLVGETKDHDQIEIKMVTTGDSILLDHEGWDELTDLKYDLECNEQEQEQKG